MFAVRRFPRSAGPVVLGGVCGLAAGVLFAVTRAGTAFIAPLIVGILALSALLRLFVAEEERARMARWMTLSFVAHIVFGLFVTESNSIRWYFAPDSFTYHDYAVQIVNHWRLGFPMPFIPFGKEGFYYLLAVPYSVLGAHLAVGIVLNAVFSAALVPIVTDTTRRLCGDRAARYAPPLVVLVPGLLVWTALLLKEAPTILVIAIATNASVRLSRRVTFTASFTFALSIALLLTLRGYVAPVVAAGLVAGIALSRRDVVSGLSSAVVALALFGVLVFGAGIGSAGLNGALSSDLHDANSAHFDLAISAGTGFGHNANISTPSRALAYLPYGMANFLFGPAPWQINELRQIPAVLDTLVWWALLVPLWWGWKATRPTAGRMRLIILLPALLLSAFHGLLLGNFGTLVRERASVLVLVVPLIAAGLAARAAARRTADLRPDVVAT